jgi:hypothetical protein
MMQIDSAAKVKICIAACGYEEEVQRKMVMFKSRCQKEDGA